MLRCSVHLVAFTLYPPGHVPYDQVPVIPLPRDGSCFVAAPAAESAVATESRWGGSLFDAAIHAAQGQFGDRFRLGHGGPWRSTRQRHIARTLRLSGLDPGLEPAFVSAIEHVLDLDVTDRAVSRESLELGAAVPMQARGRAILIRLESGRAWDLDPLMVVGFIVALWARPFRWQPDTTCLRDLVVESGLQAAG